MVCWMVERRRCARAAELRVKHTTRSARAPVEDLHYRLDVNTLHRDETATSLELNDIGRRAACARRAAFFDEYRRNRHTGSFILIDEATNETVGAGMILEVRRVGRSAITDAGARSPNVIWHAGALQPRRALARGRPARRHGLAHRPAGSGKSTVAVALERALVEHGPRRLPARRRQPPPRPQRRPRLLAGGPRRERAPRRRGGPPVRRRRRRRARPARSARTAPTATARARAPRGGRTCRSSRSSSTRRSRCASSATRRASTRKARRGELTGFTGIDDPYEAPAAPELEVGAGAVDDAVAAIVAELERLGVILVDG